jgi:hypothetical protein
MRAETLCQFRRQAHIFYYISVCPKLNLLASLQTVYILYIFGPRIVSFRIIIFDLQSAENLMIQLISDPLSCRDPTSRVEDGRGSI